MDLESIIANRKKSVTARLPQAAKPVLDDVSDAGDAAGLYTDQDLRLRVAASIQEWIETEDGDLDTGENYADRLFALMIGIADENQDGELDEDEQAILDASLEIAWDYLAAKGATEDDIDALLNEADADAGIRVMELLKNTIGDGPAMAADMDAFAFADDAEAMMDAVYKKKVAIRGGKKVRINKRVSGTVRLSAKQKMSLRKAQRKSHSAGAMMRRAKSVKIRNRTIK